MENESLLAQLAQVSKATDAEAAAHLAKLTKDQLNWRPDQDTWSVGQEFQHLLLTNRAYLPVIEDLLKRAGPRAKEYAPKFWGRFLIDVAKPDSKSNVPVPKKLVPSNDPLDVNLVEEYFSLQARFENALEAAKSKDLTAKFSSPFAWFIRLQLGDALQTIPYHNQRHIGKALRLIDHPEFPKA